MPDNEILELTDQLFVQNLIETLGDRHILDNNPHQCDAILFHKFHLFHKKSRAIGRGKAEQFEKAHALRQETIRPCSEVLAFLRFRRRTFARGYCNYIRNVSYFQVV